MNKITNSYQSVYRENTVQRKREYKEHREDNPRATTVVRFKHLNGTYMRFSEEIHILTPTYIDLSQIGNLISDSIQILCARNLPTRCLLVCTFLSRFYWRPTGQIDYTQVLRNSNSSSDNILLTAYYTMSHLVNVAYLSKYRLISLLIREITSSICTCVPHKFISSSSIYSLRDIGS